MTVNNPINEIADRPAEYQGKRNNINTAERLVVAPVIIDVENQKKDRNDRNHNEHNALILKKTEGDAGIVDESHMQNIADDR